MWGFTFNHIGHFAAAQHAVAKALFLGGVTRRFPDLRFAFLEGGVGWGCQLFCDLIEHWERRGAKGLANMDPTKLDRKLLRELVDKYGYTDIGAELDRRDGWPMKEVDSLTGGVPLDDYHFCKISQKQDWVDLFATPYYFGCEADDRMNAVAFGKMMPLGAALRARPADEGTERSAIPRSRCTTTVAAWRLARPETGLRHVGRERECAGRLHNHVHAARFGDLDRRRMRGDLVTRRTRVAASVGLLRSGSTFRATDAQ